MPIARTHVVPGGWLVEYVLYGATKKLVKRFPSEEAARAFYKSLWKRLCDEQGIRQETILGWIPEKNGWFARDNKRTFAIKVVPRDRKDLRKGYRFILSAQGVKLTPRRPEFSSLRAAERFAAGIL